MTETSLGVDPQSLVWSKLSKQQLGRYAEYYAKMEFTRAGFQVFTSEVDDRGVDFIVRAGAGVYRPVQVKSVRVDGAISLEKRHFSVQERSLLALLHFVDHRLPSLMVIPAEAWGKDCKLLNDQVYKGVEYWRVWFEAKLLHYAKASFTLNKLVEQMDQSNVISQ